jgi:hypothetical protein
VLTVEQYAAMPRGARLERLARTADQLREAIAGSDALALARRPAAAAWAPVEVVCHLRDAEEWFLTRCRFALAMDEPAFPRSNPDRWAIERQYLRNDVAGALAAFRGWRDESIDFFLHMPDAAWECGGVHTDSRGRRTIDQFLSVMAWHDDNHLDQLRRGLAGRP